MNAKTRLGWIRLYEQLGDAGLVCRRCGISRPTLRKWWRRYQAEGIVGLEERSRRPRQPAGRRSPIDRVCELTAITPSAEAVDAAYDPAKERIRVASYVTDKTLARVK